MPQAMRFFSKNLWNEQKKTFEPGMLEILGKRFSNFSFGMPKGASARAKILDFGNLFIGPTGIDLHIHSRSFDEVHKETFEHLDSAALKGGVSTAVCMANTFPRLDSVKRIGEFLKRAARCRVSFIPFAAVTKNLEGREPTDWKTLLELPIAGLSDDGKPIWNVEILKGALLAGKKSRKILSLHEEDLEISNRSVLHLSETSMRLGVRGSPSEAESSLVKRDLELALKLKAPVHLAHISSALSVSSIRTARRKGLDVSAELTPHHALLTVDDAEKFFPPDRLGAFKVCPPIREAQDRTALTRAVLEGFIDCFATDHAPHSEFEKDLPIELAAHGMTGLENFFPLMNEFRIRAKIPWSTFYHCFHRRPSQLLQHEKELGFREGGRANLLIFDPDSKRKLQWSASKSSNTPFEDWIIRGRVIEHWGNGAKLYDGR